MLKKMKKKGTLSLLLLLLFACKFTAQTQKIMFAHISDTHIGTENAAEDLRKTVEDINQNPDIQFVIHTGDVTEFGSDEELYLAKKILDQLRKPYYIVPGNHDAKWSESGCNTFVKVFGKECFSVEKSGVLFLGLASGPNMRMAPGQIPREHLQFLHETLQRNESKKLPIIFVNHYPLNDALNNWYEVIDALKQQNIWAHLMGHGHANKQYNFEGIPAFMGRSNLRVDRNNPKGEQLAAYNWVTIDQNTITYSERKSGVRTLAPWAVLALKDLHFQKDTTHYPRPDYSINMQYPQVKLAWKKQLPSDIGSGATISESWVITTTTQGKVVALDKQSGKLVWERNLKAKLYATPAVSKETVVIGATNNTIYGLHLKNGSIKWKYQTQKSVLSSPTIVDDTIYIGASDGIFRALNLHTGKLIWQFKEVHNFVETKPLVYQGKVFFGSWGNTFYALDASTGQLIWKSVKGSNRMLSPAVVQPVGANGKVFIVAPDRYMTAFDGQTGKEIYYSNTISCREAIGIAKDEKAIYVKAMSNGDLFAIDPKSEYQEVLWKAATELGYEIAPTPIVDSDDLVFIAGQNGLICAISKITHEVAWKHKVSNTLLNSITPLGRNSIVLTTMDGQVSCLTF
jgi:outer membrane protein assembly factor BamB/predicted phosphodiesterase